MCWKSAVFWWRRVALLINSHSIVVIGAPLKWTVVHCKLTFYECSSHIIDLEVRKQRVSGIRKWKHSQQVSLLYSLNCRILVFVHLVSRSLYCEMLFLTLNSFTDWRNGGLHVKLRTWDCMNGKCDRRNALLLQTSTLYSICSAK